MLEQITPLILTYNEAPNIGGTLNQLRWASEIVVVDSFSTDETVEILSSFPQVRLYRRAFDSHEQQWNFGLKETGITSEWVLALDADYLLTPEFTRELETLDAAVETRGYRARFVYCINGKRIRSGVYPPVTVLYRRDGAGYTQDGHTHRLVLTGPVKELGSALLHDDRKPLKHWLEAQARYTELEARKLLVADPETLGWTDRMRRWRVVAPVAMLFYCLVVRGGVWDGWPGFYYAFQRMLAELMLSLYLIECSFGGEPVEDCELENCRSGRAVHPARD